MEPIRNFLRHKKAAVKYYEAEATKIDYEKRLVYINDESPIKGDVSQTQIPFDMLVVGVGAENATFGTSHASCTHASHHAPIFPACSAARASTRHV